MNRTASMVAIALTLTVGPGKDVWRLNPMVDERANGEETLADSYSSVCVYNSMGEQLYDPDIRDDCKFLRLMDAGNKRVEQDDRVH